MLAADALTEVLAARPVGDKTQLRALVRALVHAGLAPVLIRPDSKEPFCPLPARTKGKADQEAREAARAAGQRRWEAARHGCGKKHVVTAENATRFLGFAERTYGVDAVNVALNVGRSRLPDGSRLLVVDADTSDQVAAFLTSWGTGLLLPTVVSPGKVDEHGVWSHRGGGHYWFTVPAEVELPERMGTYAAPAGWVAYWGEAYVLVPPSTRPEGPYRWTGQVHPAPAWLLETVTAPDRAWRERAEQRATVGAHGDVDWSTIDRWSAGTPWAALLEPDGWSSAGTISTCGCDEWTAPGSHGSPKSATAHDLGCGQFDDTPGHNPLHVWTDAPPDFLADAPKTVTKLQYVAWRDHGGEISGAIGALGLGESGPAPVPLLGTVEPVAPAPGPGGGGLADALLAGLPPVHTETSVSTESGSETAPGPLASGMAAAFAAGGLTLDRDDYDAYAEPTGGGATTVRVLERPSNGHPAAVVLGTFAPAVPTGTGSGVWAPFAPPAHRLGVPDPVPVLPGPVPAAGTRLPDAFWSARPLLAHVRDAARRRMCSPDAVLHALLATTAAAIPHTVRVVNSLGDVPLSLYTVLCGPSGSGKTSAVNLAETLFGDEHAAERYPIPSAEGVAEAFMGTVVEQTPHPDDDDRTVTRKVRRQVRHNVLFHVDEAEVLGRAFERRENAIGGALREAWNGQLLGAMNASEDRRRVVARDSYHVGLIVGAQPLALGFLVGETSLGTAQRFLFAMADDPDAVDHGPGQGVERLPWAPPGPRGITPPGLVPELPGGFPLRVVASIDAACRAAKLSGQRGQAAETDSQRPVTLLKLAGVLAYLDGRDLVAEGDWELATCLYDTSAAVRADMVDLVDDAARLAHQAEADRRGAMAATARRHVDTAAAADTFYSDHLHTVLVRAGEPMTTRALAKTITTRHRARVDEFLEVAVSRGLVVPAEPRRGFPAWQVVQQG